jgi:ADP-ribose pyrophosphatase YjhB (NUDIX family)
MREEVGLDATVGELIAVHSNFHDRDKQTVGVWFAATVTDGETRPDQLEITTAEWFDPADPPSPTYPTDALVLAQLAGQGHRRR